MANSFTNSKGVVYYFHRKGHLQYFSKDPKGSVEISSDLIIIENKKTGLPLAKKKK